MKTYNEMAQSALERIENHEAEQKKKRKAAAKIAVPAVSLCLAAVLGFTAWQTGMFAKIKKNINTAEIGGAYAESTEAISENSSETAAASADGNEKITETTDTVTEKSGGETVITAGSEGQKGVVGTSDNGFCRFYWNGLNIGGTLYQALQNDLDGEFKVTVTYHPPTANITSFTYEGKTLSELAIEADNETVKPEKMKELLKVGDELKYGTALYEKGTPEGVKWDKRLYYDKVAYFGDELLNKYIVNGEFRRDALEKDIANYNERSAREKYKRAYNAYMEDVIIPASIKKLSDDGIKCERIAYAANGITFSATAAQLEDLPLDDLKNWYVDLADSSLKGFVTDTAYSDDFAVYN